MQNLHSYFISLRLTSQVLYLSCNYSLSFSPCITYTYFSWLTFEMNNIDGCRQEESPWDSERDSAKKTYRKCRKCTNAERATSTLLLSTINRKGLERMNYCNQQLTPDRNLLEEQITTRWKSWWIKPISKGSSAKYRNSERVTNCNVVQINV